MYYKNGLIGIQGSLTLHLQMLHKATRVIMVTKEAPYQQCKKQYHNKAIHHLIGSQSNWL